MLIETAYVQPNKNDKTSSNQRDKSWLNGSQISSLKNLTWSKIPSKSSVDLERRYPCKFLFRSAFQRRIGVAALGVWGPNVGARKLGSQQSTIEMTVTHSLLTCRLRSLLWLEKNVCLNEGLKKKLYNILSKQLTFSTIFYVSKLVCEYWTLLCPQSSGKTRILLGYTQGHKHCASSAFFHTNSKSLSRFGTSMVQWILAYSVLFYRQVAPGKLWLSLLLTAIKSISSQTNSFFHLNF